jgi:hypothetical protein
MNHFILFCCSLLLILCPVIKRLIHPSDFLSALGRLFALTLRTLDFIEYLIDYGDENMNVIDTLDYEKVIEIAQNMGYDPTKPAELNNYISDISKMDLWDISKILFFGK